MITASQHRRNESEQPDRTKGPPVAASGQSADPRAAVLSWAQPWLTGALVYKTCLLLYLSRDIVPDTFDMGVDEPAGVPLCR